MSTKYTFMKNTIRPLVKLGGKVFTLEMPSRSQGSNDIHAIDMKEFERLIFHNKGYKATSISSIRINGIIAITYEISDIPDDEIMDFIAHCASKCTFE